MPESSAEPQIAPQSSWTGADVRTILLERGWLSEEHASTAPPASSDSALDAWLGRAAALLGPHAVERADLAELLRLVFHYDAAAALQQRENQSVLLRTGAREVVRELANRVLDRGDIDSDRFKEIVEGMKAALPYRSRVLFHPIRLALTGQSGEGELDRVILLLDDAAKLNFAVRVKGTRQRMIEFCAALD